MCTDAGIKNEQQETRTTHTCSENTLLQIEKPNKRGGRKALKCDGFPKGVKRKPFRQGGPLRL